MCQCSTNAVPNFPPVVPAGLIGTAPSAELLAIWNEREGALVEAGESATTLGSCLHTRPLGALESSAAE
jgi:formamidase